MAEDGQPSVAAHHGDDGARQGHDVVLETTAAHTKTMQ